MLRQVIKNSRQGKEYPGAYGYFGKDCKAGATKCFPNVSYKKFRSNIQLPVP